MDFQSIVVVELKQSLENHFSMQRKKNLVLDFLDWKQNYRSLSTIQQFILIGLISLQMDSYLDFLLHNSIPHGNYGVLEFIYKVSNNQILAIAMDIPYMIGCVYLAFWFLIKGTKNANIWAIFLFAITLASPGFI
jgi:hypothetical protein